MRKSVREQNSAAAAKAKTLADLAGACRQRDFYANQEARLSVLASESFDEVMGDREEELSARRALKKSSLKDGRASSNQSSGNQYSSPARQNQTSHKRNQVSSPSAHYAPNTSSSPVTALTVYFEPGGEAEQDLRTAFLRTENITRTSGNSMEVANEKTVCIPPGP
jgi:hypothetical protein